MGKIDKESSDDATYLASIYGVHKTDSIHAAMASMHDCWVVTFDYELKTAASKAGIEVFDPRDLV